MDQELKTKWIAALRSGDYKQGVSKLCSSSNQYCCLGVLCEVAEIPKFSFKQIKLLDIGNWVFLAEDYMYYKFDSTRYESTNIQPRDFDIENCHIQNLISMNDEQNHSFSDIANWIEEII